MDFGEDDVVLARNAAVKAINVHRRDVERNDDEIERLMRAAAKHRESIRQVEAARSVLRAYLVEIAAGPDEQWVLDVVPDIDQKSLAAQAAVAEGRITQLRAQSEDLAACASRLEAFVDHIDSGKLRPST